MVFHDTAPFGGAFGEAYGDEVGVGAPQAAGGSVGEGKGPARRGSQAAPGRVNWMGSVMDRRIIIAFEGAFFPTFPTDLVEIPWNLREHPKKTIAGSMFVWGGRICCILRFVCQLSVDFVRSNVHVRWRLWGCLAG